MKRPISKRSCELLLDYIYQSLNFEFDDNKYIIIYNGCEATYIPIHNVTYKVESGKCWKTFTMKSSWIYSEKLRKFEKVKVSVSVCLSHNRAIKVKKL